MTKKQAKVIGHCIERRINMEKQGKEQTTVRLPVELKKAIEKEADKYSVSLNEMINRLLYEGLRVIHRKG